MNHLRILLIEDEAMMAEIYERMLSRLVAAFPSALIQRVGKLSEAKKIIESLPPDVAILDLNLEDATSDETVREIQSISKTCPVVVVTGLDDPKLSIQTRNMGAHRFIHKRELHTNPGIIERAVLSAITAFKINKREGLSHDIEALRQFALTHNGPET